MMENLHLIDKDGDSMTVLPSDAGGARVRVTEFSRVSNHYLTRDSAKVLYDYLGQLLGINETSPALLTPADVREIVRQEVATVLPLHLSPQARTHPDPECTNPPPWPSYGEGTPASTHSGSGAAPDTGACPSCEGDTTHAPGCTLWN